VRPYLRSKNGNVGIMSSIPVLYGPVPRRAVYEIVPCRLYVQVDVTGVAFQRRTVDLRLTTVYSITCCLYISSFIFLTFYGYPYCLLASYLSYIGDVLWFVKTRLPEYSLCKRKSQVIKLVIFNFKCLMQDFVLSVGECLV
jgi:hypothetical protein